jgi:Fe/S biogenesis protein NfuA
MVQGVIAKANRSTLYKTHWISQVFVVSEVNISENAQSHFVKLLEQQPEGTHIRVFVVNPGTPNAECGVSYCPPEAVESSDTEIKFNGFSAFIDELSLPFLDEAEIDFVTDKMGSQLTLRAPNAKMRKVADDAPLMERVDYVIQSQVNPQLASHGGHVNLIEITDDSVAILQFGGGCNGCSMVDVTLKEGIEKQLLAEFSGELNGVRDVTEHARGDHSYY